MQPYAFERTARTRTTAVVVAAIWIFAAFAVWAFDASLVLMALLILFTAPALYDLVSNCKSGLRIDADGLHWYSGRRTGDVAWSKIDHIRLDTRLDFSVRASAVLVTGRKLRLPLEAIPKAEQLEAVLQDRDIETRRHHFSLLG